MERKKTIYIIDDDLMQNEIHTLILDKVYPDYQVKTFTRYQDALDHLAADRPHLLFLDLNIPGEDVRTFLRQLKDMALDTDVYLISSRPYLVDTSLLTECPAVKDFISKPLLEDKLRFAMGDPV